MSKDIFDKYAQILERRGALAGLGHDPFRVTFDSIVSATEARLDGRPVILFGTNNYLGVTFDEDCIEAAVTAVRRHGTGTTGSRIANGSYGEHAALERRLAEVLGYRHVIVFSTGYQANLGMLAGLAVPHDAIFLDSDSHASIYDGARLSGANIVRFRHNDPDSLDKRLARTACEGIRLVVIEGLYSMLGDTAPLAEFVEVKKRHDAWLVVDEAHSFGVCGAGGAGLVEEAGLREDVDFVVGTFSKSLDTIGGFGASDHPNFDILRYCSRPYMYTASHSPATVGSAARALELLHGDTERRARLWDNARVLHEGIAGLGFELMAPPVPIIAVLTAYERTAYAAWRQLLEAGVYVNLALPRGTPGGLCLLRCSASAAHTPAQVDRIIASFGQLASMLPRPVPESV